MQVISDQSGEYKDGIDDYYDFRQFEEVDDIILFHGYATTTNKEYKERFKDYGRKISYCAVQPCDFLTGIDQVIADGEDREDYFEYCYTVCPYTAEWLNSRVGREKFKLTTIPYNKEHATDRNYPKKWDVMYWGGLHSDIHRGIVEKISKFDKYNFFTIDPTYWTDNRLNDPLVEKITGTRVPRPIMWKAIRMTKMVVVVNQLFPSAQHVANVKKISGWENNKAFSHIDKLIIPQWKTRVIEAAFNGALALVLRDPWNVVENWFCEGQDFLYFDSVEELPDRINEILQDPERYNKIVRNAYHKAMNNYTTEHIWSKFKNNE